MANFKLVISDPKTRKAYQKEVEQAASGLLGKKIGEKVSGAGAGLPGYELEITGGSDKQGFPMRRDVDGTIRKRIILALPPGFHPRMKGQRKRKSIRGNTVSSEIVQVNTKVAKRGDKPLETLLGAKEKPKEEAPKEKPAEPKTEKEEKPAERKEEPRTEDRKQKTEDVSERAEKKMGVKRLEEAEAGKPEEKPAEKPKSEEAPKEKPEEKKGKAEKETPKEEKKEGAAEKPGTEETPKEEPGAGEKRPKKEEKK